MRERDFFGWVETLEGVSRRRPGWYAAWVSEEIAKGSWDRGGGKARNGMAYEMEQWWRINKN